MPFWRIMAAMNELRVIHEATETEPFFVLNKPSGLPSAPLAEGDDSALTRLLALHPNLSCVKGRKAIECGLVHRIDTMTSGLLLVAATQSFYDYILVEQDKGSFIKTYSADCDKSDVQIQKEGFPLEHLMPDSFYRQGSVKLTVQSRFRTFGRKGSEVRPVTESSGTAACKKASPCVYETEIELSFDKNKTIQASCRIKKGFRHQVRCHLAWLGLPVKGDRLYNPLAKQGEPFMFRATGLSFPLPDGEVFSIKLA